MVHMYSIKGILFDRTEGLKFIQIYWDSVTIILWSVFSKTGFAWIEAFLYSDCSDNDCVFVADHCEYVCVSCVYLSLFLFGMVYIPRENCFIQLYSLILL